MLVTSGLSSGCTQQSEQEPITIAQNDSGEWPILPDTANMPTSPPEDDHPSGGVPDAATAAAQNAEQIELADGQETDVPLPVKRPAIGPASPVQQEHEWRPSNQGLRKRAYVIEDRLWVTNGEGDLVGYFRCGARVTVMGRHPTSGLALIIQREGPHVYAPDEYLSPIPPEPWQCGRRQPPEPWERQRRQPRNIFDFLFR